MKPLRSGCRVRMKTDNRFGGRVGTAYLPVDTVPPMAGLDGWSNFVMVFFVPDHQERARFMRMLPNYGAFADYHAEKHELGEQYAAHVNEVEVLRTGKHRRGKKHRMRVKL